MGSLAGTPQVELELLLAPMPPPRRVLTISGWLAAGLNSDQANRINYHHLQLAYTLLIMRTLFHPFVHFLLNNF